MSFDIEKFIEENIQLIEGSEDDWDRIHMARSSFYEDDDDGFKFTIHYNTKYEEE